MQETAHTFEVAHITPASGMTGGTVDAAGNAASLDADLAAILRLQAEYSVVVLALGADITKPRREAAAEIAHGPGIAVGRVIGMADMHPGLAVLWMEVEGIGQVVAQLFTELDGASGRQRDADVGVSTATLAPLPAPHRRQRDAAAV